MAPDRAEAIVVGAGLVGAAVTYRLARGGARVALLDAGEPGRGTSAASFAWLNSHNKQPRAYHDLNVAGIAEHRALAAEFAAAPWLHLDGGHGRGGRRAARPRRMASGPGSSRARSLPAR